MMQRLGFLLRVPIRQQIRHASSYLSPPRINTRLRWRHAYALSLVPAGAGLALYSNYTPPAVPTLNASPPNSPKSPAEHPPPPVSPTEERLHVGTRSRAFFHAKVWEPLLTATRFVYLFVLFVPVILTSPMLLVGRTADEYQGERWGAAWWYSFLVKRMESAGPAFVKLAQWAGSRADLFPALLCDHFGRLHSSGKPHKMKHTRRQIEAAFQRNFDDIFDEFDEEPIGTGAIAQVYRAKLKPDVVPPSSPRHQSTPAELAAPPSASVAIKVLHPRVTKLISRDLSIIAFFAHALTLLPGMHWLSLPEEVAVFRTMMFEQLDLRIEAQNLLSFEENFAGRDVPVAFPRPLVDWSTSEVLVEEFEHALPLEVFLKNGGGPFDGSVAATGLDAFMSMLLLDNFVHSDLHPGNIMLKFHRPPTVLSNIFGSILPATEDDTTASSDQIVADLSALADDPTAWRAKLSALSAAGYIPTLIFLDAGLVSTLSSTNRRNFLEMFRSMLAFDGYRTGQLMVQRSRTPELAVDTDGFARKIHALMQRVKDTTFSLGQLTISDVLTDVLHSVREHRVKIEGDFANTVISVLVLEGIGRQLDPGLDLFGSAVPILRQLAVSGAEGDDADDDGEAREPTSLVESAQMVKMWMWLEARRFFSGLDESDVYNWFEVPG
ncbi:ABC1-domain-containing protein [Mycena kentingensis (nom. inval.)]|nr:ABC1-domain-containing protein [Mycena kentingensis (nom. inval.)]